METLLGLMFGGVGLFLLMMLGVGIAAFVFWLKMFIVAVKNNYEHKGVWILILFLFNLPGAFAFYFVPYQQIKATRGSAQSTSSQ